MIVLHTVDKIYTFNSLIELTIFIYDNKETIHPHREDGAAIVMDNETTIPIFWLDGCSYKNEHEYNNEIFIRKLELL